MKYVVQKVSCPIYFSLSPILKCSFTHAEFNSEALGLMVKLRTDLSFSLEKTL